jgi:hypothetical protein
VYLEQVERELMQGLEQMVRAETWQPLSADLPVLKSSNELVEALKSEMRDCTARVTRGRALLDLAAVFRVGWVGVGGRVGARWVRGGCEACRLGDAVAVQLWGRLLQGEMQAGRQAGSRLCGLADDHQTGAASCLLYCPAALLQRVYRAYAARLVARLPKTASGGATVAVLGGTDWYVRMSEEDIGVVCLVISTAEHCQEMVRQLARALAAKLEPRELASRWVPGFAGCVCERSQADDDAALCLRCTYLTACLPTDRPTFLPNGRTCPGLAWRAGLT